MGTVSKDCCVMVASGIAVLFLPGVDSSGAIIACSPPALAAEVPPLLEGVKGGSGWDYLGFPPPANRKIVGTEGVSPDLTQRLAAKYPPGSDPETLRIALVADGFEDFATCSNEPTVRHASFRRPGMLATVAWKLSSTGRIEWTKGFVAYDGP